MSDIPQAAIDAAYKAVRDSFGTRADMCTTPIRYALAAAAPLIAAAERERICQLIYLQMIPTFATRADDRAAEAVDALDALAGLLREPPP
jgi:acyl-CoA reductase-like NAD-dependent aldehyde dehydrogenase